MPAEPSAPAPLSVDPDPQAVFLLHAEYDLIAGKARSRLASRRHLYIALAAFGVCCC